MLQACGDAFSFLLSFAVLVVQFQPAIYLLTEGERASIRVVLNFAASRPVTVDFSTRDDSALGMSSLTTEIATSCDQMTLTIIFMQLVSTTLL